MPINIRWRKATIFFAVFVLCCFAFAGTALAAHMEIYVPGSDPIDGTDTNVVKADHIYDYTIEATGLQKDLDLFCDDNIQFGFPFPESDNFNEARGKTLTVYVTVDGAVYTVPVVPCIKENVLIVTGHPSGIDFNGDLVSLTIQSQSFPREGTVTGFKIEGLRVKNPREYGKYCVTSVQSLVCDWFECMNLNVVETVGNIDVKCDLGCMVNGQKVTFFGRVLRTDGAPWAYTSWPVVVEIRDSATGRLAQDPNTDQWVKDCTSRDIHLNPCSGVPIQPVVTHTDSNGRFQAQLTLPACPGTYYVVARTIEVRDENVDEAVEYFDTADSWKVPAESIEDIKNANAVNRNHILRGIVPPAAKAHAWVQSDPYRDFRIVPGVPFAITMNDLGAQLDCSQCYELRIVLRDKYGNVTMNTNPCCVRIGDSVNNCNLAPIKVDLKAFQNIGGAEVIAGRFYSNPRDCSAQASQIDHTYIAPGADGVSVWFHPDSEYKGNINIRASSIINDVHKLYQLCDIEVNCIGIKVEPSVKVPCTDGSPRAGWLVKVSVFHKYPTQKMRVELLDPKTRLPVNWATWDTEGVVEFEHKGRFTSGDTYVHPNVSYDIYKSDIYIYTNRTVEGKLLLVKLVNEERNAYGEALLHQNPFCSPVEMNRFVKEDTWQVISTPKKLAGAGTMCSLVGSNYTDALTYDEKNKTWNAVTTQQLDPLHAYFIKTKQNPDGDYFLAKYIFDRTDHPGGTIPPTRDLPQGWSLVGTSLDRGQWEYIEWYPWDEYSQPSSLYKMLGTTCDQCKKVYNPGGLPDNWTPAYPVNDLGNLAPFVAADIIPDQTWYLDDKYYTVFNGDGYWLYLTQPATLVAETQLELVDP
ncbi:MAG: hypothetical protein AB1500_09845 [Bacillota bacterium]